MLYQAVNQFGNKFLFNWGKLIYTNVKYIHKMMIDLIKRIEYEWYKISFEIRFYNLLNLL